MGRLTCPRDWCSAVGSAWFTLPNVPLLDTVPVPEGSSNVNHKSGPPQTLGVPPPPHVLGETQVPQGPIVPPQPFRSEERRVGQECRPRGRVQLQMAHPDRDD